MVVGLTQLYYRTFLKFLTQNFTYTLLCSVCKVQVKILVKPHLTIITLAFP